MSYSMFCDFVKALRDLGRILDMTQGYLSDDDFGSFVNSMRYDISRLELKLIKFISESFKLGREITEEEFFALESSGSCLNLFHYFLDEMKKANE